MGSQCEYDKVFTVCIDKYFSEIEKLTQSSLLLRIISFAYIQRNLRDNIFATNSNFNLDKLLSYFDNSISYLKKFTS